MPEGEDIIDLSSFVPDTFKGEDGAYDTAKFRSEFDALSSFKAQADEHQAALPKEAKDYAWALPEGHVFPEGFDPAKMVTKDESGNEVAFDPISMLDASDPDVAAVQAILHEAKADPSLMGKLASVMVNREIRGIMSGEQTADEEMAKLGNPAQSQARINTIAHAIKARLPAPQAAAIMDSLTTADAVRGMESLLKASASVTPSAPGKQDTANMSADQRLAYGIEQRAKARG